MKRDGFTITELLAVILILGILSLITVPIISNIIGSARKQTFIESVNGIIESANNYMSVRKALGNIATIEYPIVFTCEGVSCKNNSDEKLEFTRRVPISGRILISDTDTLAEYITDGRYCAYGYKGGLQVTKSCDDIDITKPTITGIQDGKVVTLTMLDDKSGIDSYCATTDLSNCTWTKPTNPSAEVYIMPNPGTWYFMAKDKKGNISDTISFTALTSMFNYPATETTYTASVACSDGRTLSNGNCTYYYSSNASKCGTQSCNCHSNGNCSCISYGKTRCEAGVNNGECFYDSNWCNTYACGQDCDTCAKSCTVTENSYKYYTCNSGDTLSGTTCYHYTCPSGGTLSGTTCVR